MDKQQLQAIKERAEKATAGEWQSTWYGSVQIIRDEDDISEVCDCWLENEVNDANFIAHARQDVPALIAEVEMLQNDKTLLINALQSIYAICSVSENVRQNIDLLNIDEIAFDILNKMEGLDEQSSD